MIFWVIGFFLLLLINIILLTLGYISMIVHHKGDNHATKK